jgi:UDP:flavonoid glycosyltransferase YjiC (YdhE family)
MLVLLSPLDWGLGHASRCVPLVRALRAAGHEVVLCAAGGGLELLRGEFPGLTFEEAPGHAMRYARRRALLAPWLMAQVPLFLLSARRDRKLAEALVRKHGAGLVIADGRYGFRSRAVPSVFVTHQLDIIPPGPAWLRALVRPVLRRLNRRALRAFSEVWVPDFAGEPNLSGELGHPVDSARVPWPRAEYIGPLDRFAEENGNDATGSEAIDILAMVSGPEPQRTLFEEKLRSALDALPGTRVLVRGKPGAAATSSPEAVAPGALTVFDHLPGARLRALMRGARAVVCRSGYTTVMELAGLARTGILFVATPGQSEQEYLAEHAERAALAARMNQDALIDADALRAGLRAAATLPGFARRRTAGTGEREIPLTAWVREHPLLAEASPAPGSG